MGSNSKGHTILLISLITLTAISIDIYQQKLFISPILIISIIISSYSTNLWLKKLKVIQINQIIRKEGPSKHLKEKQGTPTLGGLIIVPIGLIIANITTSNSSNQSQILSISALSIFYMLIGLIDDWKSFSFKKNSGLKPKTKLILEAIGGFIFIEWAQLNGWIDSNIYLLQNHSMNVGIFLLPIGLFALIAESNSTNLTDGLDGLASGCGALVFTGLAVELIVQENSEYYGLAVFCIAMAGTWLGFLIFNKNPAKIFMGDTGSLPMGAALASVGLLSNTLGVLLVMGGIFLIEAISVITQVITFKVTKRLHGKGYRVFKMTPIHHHFELNGVNEVDIVKNFWLITFCFIVLAFLLK